MPARTSTSGSGRSRARADPTRNCCPQRLLAVGHTDDRGPPFDRVAPAYKLHSHAIGKTNSRCRVSAFSLVRKQRVAKRAVPSISFRNSTSLPATAPPADVPAPLRLGVIVVVVANINWPSGVK